MRSFAIDEPGSSVRALYATLDASISSKGQMPMCRESQLVIHDVIVPWPNYYCFNLHHFRASPASTRVGLWDYLVWLFSSSIYLTHPLFLLPQLLIPWKVIQSRLWQISVTYSVHLWVKWILQGQSLKRCLLDQLGFRSLVNHYSLQVTHIYPTILCKVNIELQLK